MSLAGLRIGVLTASASRLGGGVFEAVVQQAAMIRAAGGDARLFALQDCHSEQDRHRFDPSPITFCRVAGPAQVGFAPTLVDALIAADLDCLHLHGIWMYPTRAGLAWARRTTRPLFISPHGMLDPWITARGRWKKALARIGYERAAWRAASALHALSAREAEDIARESGRADSLVIPNPAPPPSRPLGTAPRAPHAVFIGRIHPKKNLPALVEAWSRARLPPGAGLTIAGWGDAADVAALEAAVRTANSVEFIGPIFGDAKLELFQRARFMILPSHSEGLPLAVLESWAAGTPTVMTPECNLPEGFAAGAAIECGYHPEAIAAALERAMALDEPTWRGMSEAALELARGPFSAGAVGRRWAEAYRLAVTEAHRQGASRNPRGHR